MNGSDTDGLGVSVAIFMGAIMGVIILMAVPVWLAVRPQVYDNPHLAQADSLLNGPIIGNRASTGIPLALLKHETIVDPKVVAALNAKLDVKLARNERTEPVHRALQREAPRNAGTPVAEWQPERRQRSGFFLFDLFGG